MALNNQLGQANKHVSHQRKMGEDSSPYARFYCTPAQFELRNLSTVIAGGSGNALVLFAHAHSDVIGKGSHDYLSSAYSPPVFDPIRVARRCVLAHSQSSISMSDFDGQ